MMTIMGIIAERNDIDIENATAEVEKVMGDKPRRISEIKIKFNFFSEINQSDREKLERAAKTCPVSNSLSKNLKEKITFIYN